MEESMLVRIHSANVAVDRCDRVRLESRFRIAVDPVVERIRWAGIQLALRRGEGGSAEYRCRITMTLRSAGVLFVEQGATDLERAVSRAAMESRRAALERAAAYDRDHSPLYEAEVHYVDEREPALPTDCVPAKK